jgi:hypothetical protein
LVVRCSPFAVRHSPFAVLGSLFAVRRSLFSVRRSLFAVRCSPFAVRRSLFAVLGSPPSVQHPSPLFTCRGRRHRCIPGHERQSRGLATVECHGNHMFTGRLERQVDHDDSWRLDFLHPGWRFHQLQTRRVIEQYIAIRRVQPDSQLMIADFSPQAAHQQHHVGPGMNGRVLRDGNMPPDADHRQLALLVDQRVIAQQGQIDPNDQLTRMLVISSPC